MTTQNRTTPKPRFDPSARRRSRSHPHHALPTPNVEAPVPHQRHPDLVERRAFARRTDDAQSLKDLKYADLILIGVSCTGKTTICEAIATSPVGLYVANVPVVLGLDLPNEVYELPSDRVIGLTAHPAAISDARLARCIGHRGFDPEYADFDHIQRELMHARDIFRRHPLWRIVHTLSMPAHASVSTIIRLYSSSSKHLS